MRVRREDAKRLLDRAVDGHGLADDLDRPEHAHGQPPCRDGFGRRLEAGEGLVPESVDPVAEHRRLRHASSSYRCLVPALRVHDEAGALEDTQVLRHRRPRSPAARPRALRPTAGRSRRSSKTCRRVGSPSASRGCPLACTYRKLLLTVCVVSTSQAIRDRRAPVTSERLRPQLHARRRLPALVLGAVDERDGPLDHRGVELRRAAPRATGPPRRTPRARDRARRTAGSSPSRAGRRAARRSARARSCVRGISSRPACSFRCSARR